MNYSQVYIANLALGRIGARNQIASFDEDSPNAIKVKAVWDAIFQEVLSERDWRFAKTRTVLQMIPEPATPPPWIPLYGYRHAWGMPADYLRFVRPHRKPPNRTDYYWGWGYEGNGWYRRSDPPLWPPGFPYVIETIPQSGGNLKCVLIDYGGWHGPIKINYIQIITDMTMLMPGFVNCLAFRLAGELAIPVAEDKGKWQAMMEAYMQALASAEAQNEGQDWSDETGSRSWIDAGRGIPGY